MLQTGRRTLLSIGIWLCTFVPTAAQSSFARGTPLQWPGVLTGAFIGFLLLSAAYHVAFFAILRERFLAWQILRVVLLVALTVSLSSLPLGPWFSGESEARQVLINLLFDATVAVSAPFLGALLEKGTIGPRLRHWLGWQPLLVASTTPAMLLDPSPPLYMDYRDAVLAGLLATLCIALALAIVRGSRAARLQALAWFCVLAVCGISLYHDIVLGRPFGLFLYALFAALALEMLVTSINIGDRMMRLKRQHEEARLRANVLQVLAETDPLTGLGNRRGMELRFARHRPTAVAIVDVDQFKAINDRHGHDRGDGVIRAVGAALNSGEAYAARLGGEEFVLLLYGEHVREETEQLRRRVPRRVASDVGELDGAVTASAGVAAVVDAMDLAEALKLADLRLYEAKRAGRDRTVGPDAGKRTAVA